MSVLISGRASWTSSSATPERAKFSAPSLRKCDSGRLQIADNVVSMWGDAMTGSLPTPMISGRRSDAIRLRRGLRLLVRSLQIDATGHFSGQCRHSADRPGRLALIIPPFMILCSASLRWLQEPLSVLLCSVANILVSCLAVVRYIRPYINYM